MVQKWIHLIQEKDLLMEIQIMGSQRDQIKVEVRILFGLYLCLSEEFAPAFSMTRQHGGQVRATGDREKYDLIDVLIKIITWNTSNMCKLISYN